jgi:hypothetical protein
MEPESMSKVSEAFRLYAADKGLFCRKVILPRFPLKMEDEMVKICAAGCVLVLTMGCGSDTSKDEPNSSVAVAETRLSVLNGPTEVATPSAPAPISGAHFRNLTDGHYRLSPQQMTMTLTGVGFIPNDGTVYDSEIHDVENCEATYDRSLGSLVSLAECSFSVTAGTFRGVIVRYNTTYTMVMNDEVAGIYSDPEAPGNLTSTKPEGGGKPIQITDENSGGENNYSWIYFLNPLEISADSVPPVYVVFDPTHWIMTTHSSGTFTAPQMAGNPPIMPAVSAFGKAAFYSNVPSPMSYRTDQCQRGTCMTLLFLYADVDAPVSVTWQDQSLCTTGDRALVVSYAGDGLLAGTFGMLGLDPSGNLSWASPGEENNDGDIEGYSGVFSMTEVSDLGRSTTLRYKCTSDVPSPSSGHNYASGAPQFTPDGTLSLRLLQE